MALRLISSGGPTMARALWSGAIAFGLVNIPVKLYGATETKDLSFTTLHATCMTALKRPYICPKDNVPVDSKEMVKGFEYAKGQYVILKDEDFEKIPLEATKALEVAGFVDATEISPLYRERNYYLGPEEISLKPFELFRQALMRSGKVALARAVLWKKEQLVAISPFNGSLVLTTLMYQDEVKPPPEPPATRPVVISDAEIDLALQLIKTLATEFDPSKFRDRYRDALMALIQAKVEGKELPSVTKVETKPTQDLMAALKASLEAAKASGTDGAIRPVSPRHQADARGEPRDSLRFEGSHLRAEVGRHPGARDRARRASLSKPAAELRRVPLSGPRGPHAETRDPRRGDRGHERAAAQFRETPGAGASERQDQGRVSCKDSSGHVHRVRCPVRRGQVRHGPLPDGAQGDPAGSRRGRRSGRPERLYRGPRGRLLQRGHRARSRGHHREAQGDSLPDGEKEQGLGQDQEEDDP